MRYIVQCGHEGDILQKFDALALVMITSDAAGMSTVSGFRDRFTYDIQHEQMRRKTTPPQFGSRKRSGRGFDVTRGNLEWVVYFATDMGVGRSK